MSGFLRRLASGVLHTDRGLHPDVGSMWSAPRVKEPFESSGEILVSPSSRPADDPAPSPMNPIPDPTMRGDHAQRTEHPTAPERGSAEAAPFKPAFKPLVPLSQRDAFATSRNAQAVAQPARDYEEFVPGDPTAPPQPASPQPAIHAESSRQPIATSPIPTSRIAAPALPASREPTLLSRPPQQPPLPASEPDSIEIHIGRIEVLAAPPPPAQPAPRPARKSLDLAEYLRRDRRTR